MKSRKLVSILLTLSLLVAMLVPLAAPAAADTIYNNFSGTYKTVTVDSAVYGGSATVMTKTDAADATKTYWGESSKVYVKMTLPAGVTFDTEPTSTNYTNYVTSDGALTFVDEDTNMLEVYAVGATKVTFNFNTLASSLDIASGTTGDVNATLEAIGEASGGGFTFDEPSTVTIAKITSGSIGVTAATATVVSNNLNQAAAEVTVQENTTGAIEAGDIIYMQIQTPDVTFTAPTATTKPGTYATNLFLGSLSGDMTIVDGTDNTEAKVAIVTPSTSFGGKLTLDAKLDVIPSVTGDIQVTVYDSKGDFDKTTLTVATVGNVVADIESLSDNTDTLYIGSDATNDSNTALSASFDVATTSGSNFSAGKTVILTLNAGAFAKAPYFNGAPMALYNSDQCAWATIPASPTDSYTVNKIYVDASDTSIAPGDIVVTASGTAAVTGTAVIGTFAAPVTVTADKTAVSVEATAQPAGDITIAEAGSGLFGSGKIELRLPEGVSFNGTPSVDVTEGNIRLGSATVTTDGYLDIPVTAASGLTSTIKVSGIKYDLNKLALNGDVKVNVYAFGGIFDGTDGANIATVVNANAVSPNYASASFVIGSTSYTVNGQTLTMDVAPYIKDNRTYLPVRYVAQALGVSNDNILWDSATQKVTLIKGDKVVQLTIGSNVMLINGISITMDVAPELTSDRTMLPFRAIAQALGATVGWDDATQTVTMNMQ